MITVTPSQRADVGAAALEYSGLSPAPDATVMDASAHASGTTSGATTVRSGATAATTTGNELAFGFYVDSGFGAALTPDSGFTGRANTSPTGDIEFLAEDRVVGPGTAANAGTGTGAHPTWLMSTIVFRHG